MESPGETNPLTTSQRRAVTARGNVLVMAGAGTGKTKTLVERCLHCLEHDGAAVDELLIVTFTEAAAAEMRERLRQSLEEKAAAHPADERWQEQLARFDLAHIGTLHGFCLKLVREHFYELGLDPQLSILDEGESRQLAGETLDEQFAAHYAGEDEFSRAVQELIQIHGGGRDENIRQLVLRLHNYSQARPDAAGWLAQQREKFSAAEPADWQHWLLGAIAGWRDEWLPVLKNLGAPVSDPARFEANQHRAGSETGAPAANEKATELAGIFHVSGNNSPANSRLKFWSKSFPPTATGRRNAKPFCASRWRICSTRRSFFSRSLRSKTAPIRWRKTGRGFAARWKPCCGWRRNSPIFSAGASWPTPRWIFTTSNNSR